MGIELATVLIMEVNSSLILCISYEVVQYENTSSPVVN